MERTIPELFAAAVREAPDKPWLFHGEAAFTYLEAAGRVAGAAAAMADLGIGRGDLVLATVRNRPSYLFTWLAIVHLGAICVAVDPRGTAAELGGLARQVEPTLVVSDRDLPEDVATALGELIEVDTLFTRATAEPPPPAAREDDAAVLIPTSGTTGRSKLVTQTHLAYVMAGEGFPYWMELTSADRLMTSLPLFHVNAPTYSVLGSIAARASLVLLPSFSASTFIDSARRYGATEFNAIGAMLEILMRQPERPDDADNPLRLCYTGPSPPEERQLEIEARFGLKIVCGYAMSESPYGMIWPHGTRPFGTLGSPRQHPTLGHVNDARVMRDGKPVELGGEGELQLRNPVLMQGYWGMPEETSAVLLEDGWLRTGDLVFEDPPNTFTFVGREKELIRRRGENVAPAQIEEALASHPAVVDAAVVGVDSELSEEEIKGFVVVRDPDGVELADIRAHAAARLTRFKVPRYLEAVTELPLTPTGRVAKHRLDRERNDREVDFE